MSSRAVKTTRVSTVSSSGGSSSQGRVSGLGSRSLAGYGPSVTRQSYGSTHSAHRGAAVGGFPVVGGGISSSAVHGGVLEYGYAGVGGGAGWGPGPTVCPPPVTSVQVNKSLLIPVTLEIDPNIHIIRTQEKEQIKTLNNQFASFINKVRFLEQQNKMMETKWSLLQDQTTSHSDIDQMFEAYISNVHMHLAGLGNEKVRLEGELRAVQDKVEDVKNKYEDEINKRDECENHFVLIKKDVDVAYMARMELEAKLDSLSDEIDFLRHIYDTELRELQAQMKDTSVVVEMDNSRTLDMDAIVAEVRAQYEDITNRSRMEAETWYKTTYEEMQVSATKYGDDLRVSRAEIAEIHRRVIRLQSETNLIKSQRTNIEAQILEAEHNGEKVVQEAKLRRQEIEAALQRAKKDMARQVREYQSLMNIKLALDIEIATYRKLLEGEESRLASGIQTISISKNHSMNYNSYPLESTSTTTHYMPAYLGARGAVPMDASFSHESSAISSTFTQTQKTTMAIRETEGEVFIADAQGEVPTTLELTPHDEPQED